MIENKIDEKFLNEPFEIVCGTQNERRFLERKINIFLLDANKHFLMLANLK